jgi:hypothetical protein
MNLMFRYLKSMFSTKSMRKENEMLKQKIEELNQERYKLELYVMRLEREINYFKSKQP